MTLPTAAPHEPAAAPWIALNLSRLAANPVAVFVLLSAILGTLIVGVAPPLRGPDETAHFLRAYGVAQGDIVPSMQDGAGRKGIFLPVSFQRDFSLFDTWQSINRGDRFDYRRVFNEYRNGPIEDALVEAGHQDVFVPYAGSEGYSPAAYLPQAAAAVLARAAGLGFLETLYLMRLAGLAAMTAVLAYAIALTPALKWAFVAIAMLPSALYGRAVINADAAAFAFSLVVVAMFLRAAAGSSVGERREPFGMDDAVRAQQAAKSRIHSPGMDGCRARGDGTPGDVGGLRRLRRCRRSRRRCCGRR